MPVFDAPAGRVGEKRVQVPFTELLMRLIILTLNSPQFTVTTTTNEVDPVVLGGTVRVKRVRLVPQPDGR